MSLTPGTCLGPYESLAGANGMGKVYQAGDTMLNCAAAAKVLPEEFTVDVARMVRSHREAEVLASPDHFIIGSTYGLVESAGTPALVLALVDGPTLDERTSAGQGKKLSTSP